MIERVGSRRSDGIERIRAWLDAPAQRVAHEQEAKVIEQVLRSDAALYIIDSRDPVLAKHRDELQLLALCAVPVLPVLNFLRDPRSEEQPWLDVLARAGLHAVMRFDSVAPERDAEARLMGGLATLLQRHEQSLERLVQARARDAERRRQVAWRLVAEALVDVAGLRVETVVEDAAVIRRDEARFRQAVCDREQKLVDDLLACYRFNLDAVEADELPLQNGSWEVDAFDTAALGLLSARLGGGAAAGAAAGVGIDLAVGGMTLGAAALTGALLGGSAQTARHYGRKLLQRWQGKQSLRVDQAVLLHMQMRARKLVEALELRGHGAVQPFRLDREIPGRSRIVLPAPLRRASRHPEWSPDSESRQHAIDLLAEHLSEHAD